MADIEHKNIADANLHEPKGVAGASSGTVYVADGLGSGAWTTLASLTKVTLCFYWDVATDGTDVYVTSPIAGDVTRIDIVSQDTATTGTSNILFDINGVGITGGTVTLSGSEVAGDVDTATPSALKSVTLGDYIHGDFSTGGVATAAFWVVITIEGS